MDWSEITPDEWGRIVFCGLLATYAATMIPRLFRGGMVRGLGALTLWAGILFAAIAAYAYRVELQAVGNRVMAVLVPGTVVQSGPKEVTVFRRLDGQFVIDGTLSGRHTSFVLDTGASAVVLRAEDAGKVGIPVRRLTYDVPVATANGRAMAAEVTLPDLSIGPIIQTGVRALVARPGALHENLLGMTFLSDLASFTVSNDRLVMRGQ